jgi:hypothetical protein
MAAHQDSNVTQTVLRSNLRTMYAVIIDQKQINKSACLDDQIGIWSTKRDTKRAMSDR